LKDLSPQQRGELLEKSDIFAAIHLDAARQGQTAAPAAEAEVDLHFTCFVPALDPSQKEESRLVELDGRRGGPIDCGPCSDFLTVSLVEMESFMDKLACNRTQQDTSKKSM
jgi:ubiquitin carboxyl-terminal hydrolase L3